MIKNPKLNINALNNQKDDPGESLDLSQKTQKRKVNYSNLPHLSFQNVLLIVIEYRQKIPVPIEI